MTFAQRNIAALDHQSFAVYKAIRQLAAGVVVDQLHRCAGYPHLRGSLLLLQIFQIHQTDGFIFIQRHLHALCRTFLRENSLNIGRPQILRHFLGLGMNYS